MRQTQSQVPEALTDRGIGWQAAGFTLTGILCLVILKTYDGSDYWLYQWFETATVDLYWSFLLPLAALFDGGRKLFERGKAIREAQKARMVEKARREARKKARQEENERIKKLLEQNGITLSPEVSEAAFGNGSTNGS
jgi:hypothetical protein